MLTSAGTVESMRVAVFGDVGGHHDELYAKLVGLGCHPEPETWVAGGWPDDLHVIQVGDLVDRGPDSVGVLDLVDAAPVDCWTQIVGNHEARYLGGPDFTDPYTDVRGRLRTWDNADRLHVAAVITLDNPTNDINTIVVTHAGIAESVADGCIATPPVTASNVARSLNASWASRSRQQRARLWRPGIMLNHIGPFADRQAGPVWASAAHEVWPSWLDEPMPFHQVHGHSAVYLWSKKKFVGGIERMDRYGLDVDVDRRHVTWRGCSSGGRFVAIDPSHTDIAAPRWEPYVVAGVVSTPGSPAPRNVTR